MGVVYLHYEGDKHGQQGEGETDDVEQRESHKDLVCRQPFVWIVAVNQSIRSKRCQGNLHRRHDTATAQNRHKTIYERRTNGPPNF